MKTGIFIVLVLTLGFLTSQAQDQITGKFWSPEKDGKIEIYKKGDKYFGKLTWVNDPRKDTKNPDPKLRNRDVLGLEFLENFKWNGKDTWEDGTIYDASSGKTYSCYITMADNKKDIKVRGFIGISLLGRTEIFERIKE